MKSMSERTYYERVFHARWSEPHPRYSMAKLEYHLVATAEIHSLGGQDPYFSITGILYENVREVAGGTMHDMIRERIPALAPFLKWHLTSVNKGPMHYIPNALYWAGLLGFCGGEKNDPPHLEYWKSTIVFGAVDSDPADPTGVFTLQKEPMKEWLGARFAALMAAFDRDMTILFDGYHTVPNDKE